MSVRFVSSPFVLDDRPEAIFCTFMIYRSWKLVVHGTIADSLVCRRPYEWTCTRTYHAVLLAAVIGGDALRPIRWQAVDSLSSPEGGSEEQDSRQKACASSAAHLSAGHLSGRQHSEHSKDNIGDRRYQRLGLVLEARGLKGVFLPSERGGLCPARSKMHGTFPRPFAMQSSSRCMLESMPDPFRTFQSTDEGGVRWRWW